MKFNLYIKQHRRRLIQRKNVSYEDALRYFDNQEFAFVEDLNGKFYKTKEELENAENIRSIDRSEFDNTTTSRSTIFESTDRQVLTVDSDRAESSSECDN